MYETDGSAGIMFLDSEAYFRSALRPTLLYEADDATVSHLEVNMSDEEFQPAKLPAKVLQHGIGMCPLGAAPAWATAVGTVKIPAAIITGKPWDGATLADTAEYVLYALTLGVSFGYGKAHVEGLASDREIQDWVASEYGETFSEWMKAMVSAADNHATIQQVLHAIGLADGVTLKTFMGDGPEFDALDLIGRQLYPCCQVTPLNQVAHPARLTARRAICGPYEVVEAPAPVLATAAATGSATSIDDLVVALSSKEDKRDQDRLKLGLSRTNGVFIGGLADMKTGIIASLSLPVPTAGFLECCAKKTKEEKVISFGQLLNSNNKARPPGDQRSFFRDMGLHDEVMLKNFVSGNYAQEVEFDLDKPSGQVGFRHFWALDKRSLLEMAEEKQKRDAEDAVDELDANRGNKRAHCETATLEQMTLDGVRCAFANLLSDGEVQYDCTVLGSEPILIQFGKFVMDWTLELATIKWFQNENNDVQKRECILCLHGIKETLMCGMASAAEEFETASLLRKNTTENMSKKDYESALVGAAAEFDDLKKLQIRRKPVDYTSRYFSSKAVAAQKKQRTAGPAPAPRGGPGGRANHVPTPKPVTGAAAAQAATWSGWSEEAATYTALRRSEPTFSAAASKKKGSFLCKPAFESALTPELSKKYCNKFVCFGKFCDPAKGCTKKHVAFYRFQADEKTEQYEFVLANKENVAINKNDAPRNLPEKYAHLVKAPSQGAN